MIRYMALAKGVNVRSSGIQRLSTADGVASAACDSAAEAKRRAAAARVEGYDACALSIEIPDEWFVGRAKAPIVTNLEG